MAWEFKASGTDDGLEGVNEFAKTVSSQVSFVRIAALYDIHGNLPALEAVLADVRQAGADEIVVGGDVLPGPIPRESLECLLDLDIPVRFIRGNGDRVVLGAMRGEEPTEVPELFRDGIRWNARQLSAEHE